MDRLSILFGWLTGNWSRQSTVGKALLGCGLLLLMTCLCGLPLLMLSLMEF